MRICKVSDNQSFKAQLSPEVTKGFIKKLDNVSKTTEDGREVMKNMTELIDNCPYLLFSIKTYNLQGDIYYGYMMTDLRSGKTHGVSYLEDKKKDLFKTKHFIDLGKEIKNNLAGNYMYETAPKQKVLGKEKLKERLKEILRITSKSTQ